MRNEALAIEHAGLAKMNRRVTKNGVQIRSNKSVVFLKGIYTAIVKSLGSQIKHNIKSNKHQPRMTAQSVGPEVEIRNGRPLTLGLQELLAYTIHFNDGQMDWCRKS